MKRSSPFAKEVQDGCGLQLESRRGTALTVLRGYDAFSVSISSTRKMKSLSTYSLEGFPGLKEAQLILPCPGFHSSPSAFPSSAEVKPGGSRRKTTLFLTAAFFTESSLGPVFVDVADVGKTPPWPCDLARVYCGVCAGMIVEAQARC